MNDEHRIETLATLDNIKAESTIAVTADFANNNPDSICRIAIAWISGDDVYSVAYLVKPPTDDFSESRKVTAEMVADSDCFADVWNKKILPSLKINTLSAYHAETLFLGIKASYEASGKTFTDTTFFIRDLAIMAQAYLIDLGNYSLPSIARKMNISLDLDSAVSRAMACVAAIDWLDAAFPNNNYGIPLTVILSGPDDPLAEARPQPNRMTYSRRGLGLFFIACFIGIGIFYQYQVQLNQKAEEQHNEKIRNESQVSGIPTYDQDKSYIMSRGTFVIVNSEDIESFMAAAQKQDKTSIRKMVRNDQVLVFADRTTIKVTGEPTSRGFVPVTITDGRFSGSAGYAPYNMIEEMK